MKVHEYARYFTRMMRYAPDETNTEEKKQFWFHRGLNYEIRIILAGDEYSSLMSMVNRAIVVEKEVTLGAERLRAKRRRAFHQSHLNMLGAEQPSAPRG